MSAVVKPATCRIRPMLERDLTEVMEIENAGYDFPWTEGIFRDCLRVGYSCWVLEGDWRMDGYAIMMVAVGEAHLLNICVRPSEQQHGYGRRLLHHLLREAQANHATTAFLEVRPSNEAAIHLYTSEGFAEVGYRRAYYPAHEGREDAIILARALEAVKVKS